MAYLIDYEKRVICTLFFLFILCNSVNAQQRSFYFRMGLSGFVSDNHEDKKIGTFFPGLTLNPGFRILKSSHASLSVSSPLTFGVVLIHEVDDYGDQQSTTFGFGCDLPIAMDLTIGLGASSNHQQPFGLLVGYGVGTHRSFLRYKDDQGNVNKNLMKFSGQLYHAGLIFPLGRKKNIKDDPKGLIIRFSYMEKKSILNPYAFSIGLILLFDDD